MRVRNFITFAVVATTFVVAPTTRTLAGSLTEQESRLITKAINENDHDKLKTFLAEHSISDKEASCFLADALFASAHETKRTCRPEIIALLLEKGAIPSNQYRDC